MQIAKITFFKFVLDINQMESNKIYIGGGVGVTGVRGNSGLEKWLNCRSGSLDHEDLVQRWMTLSAFKHGYVDGMKVASRSQCFLSHSSFGAMSPNHLAEWFCCKSPRALHDAES